MRILNSAFSIGQIFGSIDRKDEENNPGVFGWFDHYSILTRLIEKSTQLIEMNFQPIESRKTRFSAEFSGDYLESLKRFQAL